MEGGETHQVWFDDDSSLGLKYDLAIAKNLKGIGMWALGYDGTKSELWNLISEKFSAPVGILDGDKVPTIFELSQNYPNPFNPSTIIKYSIPNILPPLVKGWTGVGSQVTLKVYDILGLEVATLVNKQQTPGNYQVTFVSTGLSSGTYFYTLRYGDRAETKKMILLK